MNEERLRQLQFKYSRLGNWQADLSDLADLIEALIPDTKTGTDSWPPAGVVIEVSHDGDYWMPRISAGDGDYLPGWFEYYSDAEDKARDLVGAVVVEAVYTLAFTEVLPHDGR